MGAGLDQWLEATYPDPDDRARVAAALATGAPVEGTDPLDYAKLLGPDVARLMEPEDLPEKGPREAGFDALQELRPPLPDQPRRFTPAEDAALGEYLAAKRLIGEQNEKEDREAFERAGKLRAVENARQLRDYAIAQGIDPATILSPTDMAALRAEESAVQPAPAPGPKGVPPVSTTTPPGGDGKGEGKGGRGGGGVSFKGGLLGIADQIAKRRGKDEEEVRSIIEEAAVASDDAAWAELAKSKVEAEIAANQVPIREMQLANDLYMQSAAADVAARHAEDVQRRVTALDSRMAAYASSKLKDFDLGAGGTIGVILGGLAAAIRGDGGPNRVLALVERMIERDIDKQKVEMEKERGLIGMESDSIRSAETLAQSELTRIRVMRAERWARSDKLMAAEAGRYSGMLDQVGVTAAAAAMREKSAKVRMEAIESLRADSIRSFAVEVDARAQSGRMWVEEQKLDQGEKREPVPVPIINAIKDARVGLAEINDLAAAQEKLGAWSLVSQYVVGTYGISYDDFVTASAMKIASALNAGRPTDKDFMIAVTKMMPTAGDSDERANAKLTRLRRSLLFAEKEMAEGAVLGGHAADNFLARFYAEEKQRPLEQRVTGQKKTLTKEAR